LCIIPLFFFVNLNIRNYASCPSLLVNIFLFHFTRKVIKTPLTILWTKSAKENILIKRSTRWLNTAYIFVVLLYQEELCIIPLFFFVNLNIRNYVSCPSLLVNIFLFHFTRHKRLRLAFIKVYLLSDVMFLNNDTCMLKTTCSNFDKELLLVTRSKHNFPTLHDLLFPLVTRHI
jgi:hypothetical protein